MVFGLPGHTATVKAPRNEYNSLKKNVKQTNTPLLAQIQQNDRMNDTQKCSSPLDSVVQKTSEEQNISSKLPIKLDVHISIVPKLTKTKNTADEPELMRIGDSNNLNNSTSITNC